MEPITYTEAIKDLFGNMDVFSLMVGTLIGLFIAWLITMIANVIQFAAKCIHDRATGKHKYNKDDFAIRNARS